ncbi:H+ symporter family protein, partial [Escherichia coli 95.1288]|uniref:hypothetical protein n=1 Tax=Escherichia coli TaxID=562 RepID=UPI0002A124F2
SGESSRSVKFRETLLQAANFSLAAFFLFSNALPYFKPQTKGVTDEIVLQTGRLLSRFPYHPA